MWSTPNCAVLGPGTEIHISVLVAGLPQADPWQMIQARVEKEVVLEEGMAILQNGDAQGTSWLGLSIPSWVES